MSPMLEKIARAVIDLDGRHGLAYTEAAAERLALRYARAVLLALREPTDEMKYAGRFSGFDTDCGESGDREDVTLDGCGDIFTAMIDAILKEGGE